MMRRGFTLIELVAALGLGGVAIALAAAILAVLYRTETDIAQHAAAAENNAQRAAMVSRAFSMIRLAGPDLRTLHADNRSVKLQTQCRSAWGGLEPCEAELVLHSEATQTVLLLREGDDGSLEIRRFAGRAEWAWLELADDGPRWRADWNLAGALPLAGRITAGADTLIYSIGAHR